MKFSSASVATALTTCVVAMTWIGAQSLGAETLATDDSSKLPPITAVAIDEKNSWAIEGSQAGLIVRSWPELSKSRVLPTELEHIHDIALSPDGTMLAVAGGTPAESGAVELYQWPSGELWKRLEAHEDLVYSVAWRSDSKLLALASADKTVKTISPTTAQCVQVFEGHSRSVLSTEFLPGEIGLATAGVDESLRIWECSLTNSAPVVLKRTFTNHTRQVVDLALRPAHEDAPPVMVSIGEDNTVRLWQPTIGRMMRFAKLESTPQAVCWTSDGKSLAVACKDGKVRMVDPDTVEATHELDALSGPAYCLAMDSDGRLLVGGAGGQLKRLAIHSPTKGSLVQTASVELAKADQDYGKVELLRDRWGIPHVFSTTDEGAMYGLGCSSAEDRGFQMYYNLRQIQGRLSELFGTRPLREGGETSLGMDRRMRTIGFYRSAQAVAEKLDSRTKSLLAAYCQGVNDWFAKNPERAHPFFEKFGLKREPWTPADCIVSHWYLAQFFAGDGLDELANRRAILAGASGPPAANFIVDESASIVKRKDVSDEWVDKVERFAAEKSIPKNQAPSTQDSPKFSHAWVVGGSRTSSGKSVLVGDPQTPILNPSLFYEFHVCGESFNARGIAAPGTPGLMIGWTEHFAWSVTALGADQADLFRLETDTEHPNQYKLDGQWRDMKLHRERILVKDREPEELTVRLTHYGPVVSSIADRIEGEPEVALRRVPLSITDSETIQGFFGLMTAKNTQEFSRALAYWTFPSTNLVFGHRDGEIGYWLQAGIPARSAADKHQGQASVDGSLSRNDWQGLVPHELLPHVINPSDGWIASGNHRPIESFYPIRIGAGKGGNGHSLRSLRLYERLGQKDKFQSSEVLDIHFDMTNPGRRVAVRAGLHLLKHQRAKLSDEAQKAIEELDSWYALGAKLDLRIRGAALAGQIPLEFRAHRTPLADEFGGGQGGLAKWLRDVDARLDRESVVLSDAEVRFVDGALAAAWKKSQTAFGPDPAKWNGLASLESQKQVRGYMNHMNNLGSLDASYDMQTPELFCIDGTTIRSQVSQAYTQYVPFDDLDGALSLLPPGNSERLDSPTRNAAVEFWSQGKLHPAPLSRSAVEKISISSTILK